MQRASSPGLFAPSSRLGELTANAGLERRGAAEWRGLLALLAPEPEAAEAAYRALRERLVALFRWRGLGAPDDLADETLERVARQIGEGQVIQNVAGYVRGVANRLALEAGRREARAQPLAEAAIAIEEPTPVDPERIARLQGCLDRLPSATRALVLRYYGVDGARIAERKQLAGELGIALNALRIRVHRVRAALQDCVAGRRSARGRARGTEAPHGRPS